MRAGRHFCAEVRCHRVKAPSRRPGPQGQRSSGPSGWECSSDGGPVGVSHYRGAVRSVAPIAHPRWLVPAATRQPSLLKRWYHDACTSMEKGWLFRCTVGVQTHWKHAELFKGAAGKTPEVSCFSKCACNWGLIRTTHIENTDSCPQ